MSAPGLMDPHPEQSGTSERPKCLRVIVTAVYADGTSVTHDIAEPDSVEAEFADVEFETEGLGDIGLGPRFTVLASRKTALKVSAVLGRGGCRSTVAGTLNG